MEGVVSRRSLVGESTAVGVRTVYPWPCRCVGVMALVAAGDLDGVLTGVCFTLGEADARFVSMARDLVWLVDGVLLLTGVGVFTFADWLGARGLGVDTVFTIAFSGAGVAIVGFSLAALAVDLDGSSGATSTDGRTTSSTGDGSV